MFKALRICILLLVLFVVSANSWLTRARSTDWDNSLWVKIYPINGDASAVSERYIAALDAKQFAGIEAFVAAEAARYGRQIRHPVRIELGESIAVQPPALTSSPGFLKIMLWSLRMRWWANRVAGDQDEVAPDVRIFVRYHAPRGRHRLENSVGLQKGMVGIVNAYAGRHHTAVNNVIIAHEFMHTLGASDKYDAANGLPVFPAGYAEPERQPPVPQEYAEIMGGRIALSESEAIIPKSLRFVVIGPETAREVGLLK